MSPERSNRSETWLEQMVEFLIMYVIPISIVVIIFIKILEDEQRIRGAAAITIAWILMGYVVVKIRRSTKREGTTK
jgi:hypothetical protein